VTGFPGGVVLCQGRQTDRSREYLLLPRPWSRRAAPESVWFRAAIGV